MSPEPRKPWLRYELLIAFDLYCRTPFGKMDSRNPEIIKLAGLLGRTPGSLAMKLVNFASLDPAITSTGRVGLKAASKADRAIWAEFHEDWDSLATESAVALAALSPTEKASDELAALPDVAPEASYEGATKQVVTAVRVKQAFFRRAVLASYSGRCCMSDLAEPKLLIASHIVPWGIDKSNRLNPRNGLCLSALHDRAFDLGLISVSASFQVLVSKKLRKQFENALVASAFAEIENKPIHLPEKFRPEQEFLKWHRENPFAANQ